MPLCYVSNKLSAIIERKLIEVRVSVNTAIVQGKAIEYLMTTITTIFTVKSIINTKIFILLYFFRIVFSILLDIYNY